MPVRPWIRFVLGGALLGVLFTSPVFAAVPDAWITTRVKMALITSPEVGGTQIDVDTDQGRVTLSGKVESQNEKDEAERIAAGATGVGSVRNLLQVVPRGGRRQVNASDARIKADVAQALDDEPTLANSNIDVKSVNRGVVLLTGTAESLSDHLLALEVTNAVPGTRRVVSEIRSPNDFDDREVWAPGDDRDRNRRDDSRDRWNDRTDRGGGFTDGWITARVKMSLMTDRTVPASDINVDTRRGVVTLFGTVPSRSAKARARTIAANTSGVFDVRDELRVLGYERTGRVERNDRALAASIRRRIDEAGLRNADIDVDVRARTARLSGTVARHADAYAAVSVAYGTPGVRYVVNDLRVDTRAAGRR